MYLIKETSLNKLLCISKQLPLLLRVYTSNIVLWPGISFVLRHKYEIAATEDLVVAGFLFPYLMSKLRGQNFMNLNDLPYATKDIIQKNDKSWYEDTFYKYV